MQARESLRRELAKTKALDPDLVSRLDCSGRLGEAVRLARAQFFLLPVNLNDSSTYCRVTLAEADATTLSKLRLPPTPARKPPVTEAA
jgi:hypothetical protein